MLQRTLVNYPQNAIKKKKRKKKGYFIQNNVVRAQISQISSGLHQL